MSSLSPIGPGAAAGPTATLPLQMQQQAQGNLFNNIASLGQFQTTNVPQATQLTQNIANNPYAGGLQAGANQAGGMMQQAGQSAYNTGGTLQGAGNQVLNTAFDPQQALYNRTLQQLQQQFQATNAQSGIGSSPYAAGLNAQNLQNFNISWQAQQLQNQIAGLNAAGSAYGTGANLQQGGASEVATGTALPYNAYNTLQTTPLSALSQLQQYGTAGMAAPQQQIGDYAQLLGLQPALAGAQNQTAQTQAALQAQMVQQLGGGIGAILGLGGGALGGFGGLGALGGGLLGGSNAFGGGSPFTGDAYGGSAYQPLPGLTAEDYR